MNVNLTPTPVTDYTSEYVAMRVLSFCAAFLDISKRDDTIADAMILAACEQFGLNQVFQTIHEMRDSW